MSATNAAAAGLSGKAAPAVAVTPHVYGVDLSLTSTGLACAHGVERFATRGGHDDSLAERRTRILSIRDAVLAFVARDADLVVIEQPAYSKVAGHQHDRSGAWWLVVHALTSRGIPVAEVAPTCRARYATGKGNANKDEVLAAVVRRFAGYDVNGNDAADALVLAAMGYDHLGHPLADMPAAHRLALTAVVWPDLTLDEDGAA